MGHRLCVDLAGKHDKFANVDFAVDDMNNENPEVRVQPPAKIVNNDMVDDGNDDMDTKDKSGRIKKAAKIKEQLVDTGEHLRTKSASELPNLSEISSLACKSTVKLCPSKSLAEKMAERRNNPNRRDEFAAEGVNGEREAAAYMKVLQDNTIDQLAETCANVKLIILKETDTMEELKRQGRVVELANNDIIETEKDIQDTNFRLNGMKSLSNKLVNIMYRKKPLQFASAQIYHSDNEDNELGNEYRRSVTAPIKLPSDKCKSKSEIISDEVEQLCHLLEVVELKEREIGNEIEKQEEAMHQLDENMDHVEISLTNQTKLMSSMTRK